MVYVYTVSCAFLFWNTYDHAVHLLAMKIGLHRVCRAPHSPERERERGGGERGKEREREGERESRFVGNARLLSCFASCQSVIKTRTLQGYLAHKKQRPPRTLQQEYA